MSKNTAKNAADGYPLGTTIKRLIKNALDNDKGVFGLLVLFTVFAGVYPLCAVALPKVLLDTLVSPGENPAGHIIGIVVSFFAAVTFLGFIKNYLHGISYPRLTALRIDYVRDTGAKIIRMAYPYCEDAAFTNDNERVWEASSSNVNGIEGVYHKLFEAPAELLTIIALSIFIGLLDYKILLVMLINLAAVVFIARRSHDYGFSKRAALSKAERKVRYYSNATHDFGYGKDIRLYNIRERILNNFYAEIEGYVGVHRLIKRNEYLWGFLGLATLLLTDIVTYGVLVVKTVNGMPISDFSMYIAAAAALSLLLKSFSDKLAFVVNEGQVVGCFYSFMDSDLGEKGGSVPAVQDDTLEICFDNVSFKYPKTDRYIIKNLDLTIHKGERLAIVGINGAGKSTIVKLMTGLFAPTEGEIRINGVRIGDYDKSALYSMFSVVFQDVSLMCFTVAENVAGSSESIDRDRVKQVLEKVGLWDKICEDPMGIDRMMHKSIDPEGLELSGGQAQKMSIARALYKDANMIIMDEPTAALDALAEAEIYQDFGELVKGKTAVYISHRLASTKFCDTIAFFDADGLQEYGSHDELMKLHGKYCDMFTVQGKYYREEADCE